MKKLHEKKIEKDEEFRDLDPSTMKDEMAKEVETGGPKGAEPTRFGDWEQKGRCSDF